MATFLTDTFTGTNGTALASHTGETGATWTKNPAAGYASGAATIQTNRIFASTGLTCFYASGTPASADYEVTGTINIVSAVNMQMGIFGRLSTAADTGYLLDLSRTSGTWALTLWSDVAASFNSLGTITPATPTTGSDHILKLRIVGNQISGYYDGVLVIGPVTNTAVSAAGKAGVRASATATTTTGFHMGDISAADVAGPIGRLVTSQQAVNRAAYF